MKYTRQISILALVLMIGIPAVAAANPIVDFIQEKTEWLFFDLGGTPDDQVLVLRLLLFVVLFSILYAVTSIGPMAHFPGNARTMLAIALSLLSVVIMPAEILTNISNTYGALFTLLMIGVPTVGVGYLLFTKLKEETVENYALKAVVCLALWYVLNAYVLASLTPLEAGGESTVTGDLVSTLSLLFMVYGFYSVYAAIRVHGKSKVAGGGGWSLKNIFGFSAKAKFDLKEANELFKKIELDITNNLPDSLRVDAAKAKSELITPLQALHSELAAEVMALDDSAKKTAAETKLKEMQTKTDAADTALDEIYTLADACVTGHAGAGMAKLVPADKSSANTKFKVARSAINDVANAKSKVEQLINQAQAAPPTP